MEYWICFNCSTAGLEAPECNCDNPGLGPYDETEADCDHPSKTIEERLRDLGDRDYIYAGRGGVLTVESIAYRQFPDIDIERFADCLADRLFSLEDAVRDYLAADERA